MDLPDAGGDAFDRLVQLGALDAEQLSDGGLAALMPDSVTPARIANVLGTNHVQVSPAIGRDADSVWVLSPRATQIGRLRIAPATDDPAPDRLRLIDETGAGASASKAAAVFGTGLHPTTALCLEALQDALQVEVPDAMLDVGTGSGVLALAALLLGVPQATALDIDDAALHVAAENARLNSLDRRLQLSHGGPEAVSGVWPLVMANVLAAPLIEMAPTLIRRVGHHGQLILSGIPVAAEEDVARAYRRLGMQHQRVTSRAGWVALVLRASW